MRPRISSTKITTFQETRDKEVSEYSLCLIIEQRANNVLARNMQSASFNLLYAKSIPALAPSIAALTGGSAIGALSVSQLNQVRALLTGNDYYDFGSAAWFLTTQCSAAVRAGVQTGTLAGWQTYVTDCIGTSATSDRQRIWEIAMQEIGWERLQS